MAPGCYTAQDTPVQESDYATLKNVVPDAVMLAEASCFVNLDEIPLPASPPPAFYESPVSPPPRLFDTVDSFEILDQTIYKQKRLARAKKSPDMRLKVLLKRTFDLVCEIMDRENGIDDSLSDTSSSSSDDDLDDIELELSPERDRELCARLDIETYLAESAFYDECAKPAPPAAYEITVQMDEAYFARSLKHEFERDDYQDNSKHVSRRPVSSKRRRSSDDDSDSDEEDDDEQGRYAVEITRLAKTKRSVTHSHRHDKKRRIY
jgi:hypothetical protein